MTRHTDSVPVWKHVYLLSRADLLRDFPFLYEFIGVSQKFGEVGVDFELGAILWVKLVLSCKVWTRMAGISDLQIEVQGQLRVRVYRTERAL